MNKSLEMVKEFHETFEHPIGTPGVQEDLKIRQLRIKLIFEELAELAEASDCNATMYALCGEYLGKVICEKDKTIDFDLGREKMLLHMEELKIEDGDNVDRLEELDALCDIQYVLNGKILTGGYHEVFDKNLEIVHQNNMTKAHNSLDHANETVMHKEMIDEPYTISEKDGKFLLLNKDGKLTKPHDHVKVKLEL